MNSIFYQLDSVSLVNIASEISNSRFFRIYEDIFNRCGNECDD